jgi:hypothetical protein
MGNPNSSFFKLTFIILLLLLWLFGPLPEHVFQGRNQGGGLAQQPPSATKLKRKTNFVDTVISSGLCALPVIRNQPLKPADEF